MADTIRKVLDCEQRITRCRRSIEHDVMKRKLMEWRTKKGLPVLGKYEEEQKRATISSCKRIIPSQPMKRKHNQLPESERKAKWSTKQLRKQDTPSMSSSSQKQTEKTRSGVTRSSTTKKQPGRRSLASTTTAPVSKPPVRTVKQGVHPPKGESSSSESMFVLPLTERTNRLPGASITVQSLEATTTKEGAITKDASKKASESPRTGNRKSVRFVCTGAVDGKPAVQQLASVVAGSDRLPPTTPAEAGRTGMREKLEQWLISKGKTPARFRSFLGYESSLAGTHPGLSKQRSSGTPHHGKGAGSTPGLRGGQGSLEHAGGVPMSDAMRECFAMIEEGCPLSYISSWLDRLVIKLPLIQQSAVYWLCRAKIAEKESGDQSAMKFLFEAVEFGAEPSKEIMESLAAYRLKLTLASEDAQPLGSDHMETEPHQTGALSPTGCLPCIQPQTPIARLQFEEEGMHQSDVEDGGGEGSEDAAHYSIKYSLKEATPYFSRIHCTPGRAPATPCLMVTPVRRSARLDNRRRSVVVLGHRTPQQGLAGPGASAERPDCLESMQEVASVHPDAQLILRPNRALTAELAEDELLN